MPLEPGHPREGRMLRASDIGAAVPEDQRYKDADAFVCVGLGVSDGAQAAQIAQFADGVIVGSAFVRRLLDAPAS